jgi:hypothetical protein
MNSKVELLIRILGTDTVRVLRLVNLNCDGDWNLELTRDLKLHLY